MESSVAASVNSWNAESPELLFLNKVHDLAVAATSLVDQSKLA